MPHGWIPHCTSADTVQPSTKTRCRTFPYIIPFHNNTPIVTHSSYTNMLHIHIINVNATTRKQIIQSKEPQDIELLGALRIFHGKMLTKIPNMQLVQNAENSIYNTIRGKPCFDSQSGASTTFCVTNISVHIEYA